MKSMLRSTLLAASFLFLSNYANASLITTINLNSSIYGVFESSIDESVDRTTPYFLGQAAGYFFTGNIVFTNSTGLIENVLSTNGDDNYSWSWNSTQNSLIGTQAVASAMNRVNLLNNGVLTSYMADINAMNGNQSFCCNTSTAKLDIATAGSAAAAIPEPESYTLVLAGLGLMGFMVRRRKTS